MSLISSHVKKLTFGLIFVSHPCPVEYTDFNFADGLDPYP